MGQAEDERDAYARHKQAFGERLKDLRVRAGLSQNALARHLSGATDVSQISRWERGVTFPGFETLIELAEILGVPPGWLQWGDEQSVPEPCC